VSASPDQLPALAEVRVIEREEPASPALARRLAASPAVQAAAVGATSFIAGSAAVLAVKHQHRRRVVRRRRQARRIGGELVQILATRSFLVDVSLVDKG
jgi:enamine deaminase RidA (YjgF/YER057c/UK114 family)